MADAEVQVERNSLENTRLEELRAHAARPDAKPAQRLAWLDSLAKSDPEAAIIGLERELENKRPPDGVWLKLLRLRIRQGNRSEVDRLCTRIEAEGIKGPYWLERFLEARRTGRIEFNGTVLTASIDVVGPPAIFALATGTYEDKELEGTASILQPGDKVLELGGGMGVVACVSLLGREGITWKSVEANPAMIPVIAENRALNGVEFELEHAAYGERDGPINLHLGPRAFWGASLLGNSDEDYRVEVPGVDGARAVDAYRPNVLLMDIEGAEYDILSRIDLSGIDRMQIEFHPRIAGDAAHTAVLGRLISAGYVIDTENSAGMVMVFRRP